MATKAPQLMQHYVTGGDRSLRSWHLLLRRVTFGAALVLMAASVVSLHWACNLIGLRGAWEPVAWVVPLAMETGMAAVASTATTIRKPAKPGREEPGGYYLSLWFIFSFVMLLAQASNIGHAITTVAESTDELPPVIPLNLIYGFAAAFAALFPLGGTLFVHVSGFLRAHGTGARWIEDDAELVSIQVAPGSPGAAPVRAPQTARAPRTTPVPAAQTRAQSPAQPVVQSPAQPARTMPAQPADDEKARARAEFDRLIAADPLTKPDAARIHDAAGISKDRATSRRWVQAWWAETEAALGTGRPELTTLTTVGAAQDDDEAASA